MLSEKQINNFKKNSYIVIPNFLDQEEIGELSTSLEESKNTLQKKLNYNVLDDEKVYRDGIITRFGGQGVHSKNFMNYQLNYRKLINRILLSTKRIFFFDRLKKNNIFISPNVEQEKIEGIHVPKDQGSDGGLA